MLFLPHVDYTHTERLNLSCVPLDLDLIYTMRWYLTLCSQGGENAIDQD